MSWGPLALLLFGFGMPAGSAWALGMGDITVRSYLGQPLRARIELISRSAGELEGVSARLATAEDFRLVGMNRMSLSVPLAFSVQADSSGGFVEVQSTDPISDPIVQFVVEINFANGRLLRQYTVFLDPPTVSAPVPLPAITPAPQRSERAEPEAAPSTPAEVPEPAPEERADSQPLIREAPATESARRRPDP